MRGKLTKYLVLHEENVLKSCVVTVLPSSHDSPFTIHHSLVLQVSHTCTASGCSLIFSSSWSKASISSLNSPSGISSRNISVPILASFGRSSTRQYILPLFGLCSRSASNPSRWTIFLLSSGCYVQSSPGSSSVTAS